MAPEANFDPLRRKLARAKARLDELRVAVDAFLATNPCRLTGESSGTSYSVHSWVDAEPDQDWALDVAEIATAARSVLDQLVYQLAITNGRDPSIERTQFPIEVDFSVYTQGRRPRREKYLAGVAPKHRKIIDEYQPYHRGPQQIAKDPLKILADIANSEKHRAGHVTLGTASTLKGTMTWPNGDTLDLSLKRHWPLAHDSDIIVVTNSKADPDTHVTIDVASFTIDVGFRDGESIVLLADIERALVTVSHIVDRCIAKI